MRDVGTRAFLDMMGSLFLERYYPEIFQVAKKVTAYIKLQVKAGQASPSPPVGPALGQRGLNIMDFCKAFNAGTQKIEQGLPIPVVITAYSDRTFTFITKSPPASILLKKIVGIQSGSKRPNTEKVAKSLASSLRILLRLRSSI